MIRGTRQHIIRIYEQGTGYSLYVGSSSELSRHPLDLKSTQVSQGYLLAQHRLDEVLDSKKVSWSTTFRRDSSNTFPIVAYGGYVELPVEDGQSGIVFIHAVELSKSDDLYSHVNAVVTRLSNAGIRRLRTMIIDVALGRAKSDEQSRQIAKELDGLISATPLNVGVPSRESSEIKWIEQDCAGASSVAWLVLALQQAKVNPPWEVFDLFRHGEHLVTTVDILHGESLLASEVQRQSLAQYFQAKVGTPLSSISEPHPLGDNERLSEPKSATKDEPSTKSNDRHSLAVKWGTAKSSQGRVMSSALMLTRILIISLGFYLVYSLNHQHKDILNGLNRIVAQLHSDETSVSHVSSNSNLSLPAPQPRDTPSYQKSGTDDQEILKTIARLYDSNQRLRISAINQLQRQTTMHERMIPLALEYARDNQSNDDGVENTLIVLQRVKSESLRKHTDEVLTFLSVVENRNPRIRARANTLRKLVTSP